MPRRLPPVGSPTSVASRSRRSSRAKAKVAELFCGPISTVTAPVKRGPFGTICSMPSRAPANAKKRAS